MADDRGLKRKRCTCSFEAQLAALEREQERHRAKALKQASKPRRCVKCGRKFVPKEGT